MKKAILSFFSFLLLTAGTNLQLLSQEPLSDTVWSKKIKYIESVKCSPDGQYLFAQLDGIGEGFVYKIETLTGLIIDTFSLNRPLMNHLSISPTGDTIVVSGNNYTMFWDVNTGDTLFTLKYGEEAEITPDGKRIITTTGKMGLDEPQILVIDIATKEIIKTFVGRYYYASNLRISPDGKYFCFNDFRGTYLTAIFMNLITYEEIKIFEDPNKNSFYNFGYSPDGQMLGIANKENMYFYDLKNLELIKTLKYYEEENVVDRGVGKRVFTNDSKYLIYGYFDNDDFDPNKIIVWNIEGDSLEYEYPYSAQTAIDISKDDYIAAWGQYPGYLTLLRPKWKATDVKETKNDEFKYTLKDGILKIKFDDELADYPIINIYGISGKLISTITNINIQTDYKSIELDVSFLITGVYLFEINISNKNYTFKLLVN
ncbi:MAG: hypothetical protein V1779_10745 [bacterium]